MLDERFPLSFPLYKLNARGKLSPQSTFQFCLTREFPNKSALHRGSARNDVIQMYPLKWVRKGRGKDMGGVWEKGYGPVAEQVARHY